MTNHEMILKMIDADYEPSFNAFSRLYEDASESDKKAYDSNVREYLRLLERIREAQKAKKRYEEDMRLDRYLQKLFLVVLFILMLISIWLREEDYLVLALVGMSVYLTYEIKHLRNMQLVVSKTDELRNWEDGLTAIGPKLNYKAVVDWQNSFELRSEFYETDSFGSFGATLRRDMALLDIKIQILSELRMKRVYADIYNVLRNSEDYSYEDWVSVVPPSVLRERLELHSKDQES